MLCRIKIGQLPQKKGKGKLPLFRGNGKRVIPIYVTQDTFYQFKESEASYNFVSIDLYQLFTFGCKLCIRKYCIDRLA